VEDRRLIMKKEKPESQTSAAKWRKVTESLLMLSSQVTSAKKKNEKEQYKAARAASQSAR
jgi:hypothetical protein